MQDNNPSASVQQPASYKPNFILRDAHTYFKSFEQEPQDALEYPKSLLASPNIALAFTVANSSSCQARIQTLFIRVTEATPYRRATFPAYDLGGNGVEPITGATEIKPDVGIYRVNTTRRPRVANGTEPADFHIRIFCQNGFKYTIKVSVEWMDIDHQENTGRHEFVNEIVLEMPSITRWKSLASSTRTIKAFYNGYGNDLANELKVIPSCPEYTILLSEIFPDQRRGITDPNIFVIPESEAKVIQDFFKLVGGPGASTETRNFLLLDSTYLLLQNDDWTSAEIIEDKERIKSVEAIYDELAERLGKDKG